MKTKKKKYVYGVYSAVDYKDRYRVPNFCKMKKYDSKEKAENSIPSGTDWVVHKLSQKRVKSLCNKKRKR